MILWKNFDDSDEQNVVSVITFKSGIIVSGFESKIHVNGKIEDITFSEQSIYFKCHITCFILVFQES